MTTSRLAVVLAIVMAALGATLFLGVANGPTETAAAPERCARPAPTAEAFLAFLKASCYRDWPHDPAIRSTGPIIDGVDNSVHGRVQIYYSPEMAEWLLHGRPGAPPEGGILVKTQYPSDPAKGSEQTGYTAMMRHSPGLADGWLWAEHFFGFDESGGFGISGCLRCHGSSEGYLTFTDRHYLDGTAEQYPNTPDGKPWYAGIVAAPTDSPLLTAARNGPDPVFLAQYPQLPALSADQIFGFPNHTADHVVRGPQDPNTFVTSDQCVGCHNAYDLPNMQIPSSNGRVVNASPYGEWSVSLMGLAGRDPVFHAQLESEVALRPQQQAFIENFCYRCHGVMGQRQSQTDGAGDFQHQTIYAEPGDHDAKYGALARDGVSCAACHRIAAEGLGADSSFVGQFNVGPGDEMFGPFDKDVKTWPMKEALGITMKPGTQFGESALCGSCHVVIIPATPEGYQGNPSADPNLHLDHEQTTYLEWRNSAYQNEQFPFDPAVAQTCQGCHMPQHLDGKPIVTKIANVQEPDYPEVHHLASDAEIALEERSGYSRHTLAGINLFVSTMFFQFRSLLGVAADTDAYRLKATESSFQTALESGLQLAQRQTAVVEIAGQRRTATDLETTVRITNRAGHKFPSGVNFRRAFVEYSVLDANGRALWSSGRTNTLGVIVGPDGQPLETEFSKTTWQPHWDVITQQNQAQIYEERNLDERKELTTSFLGLFYRVKDNRLLPKGWHNDLPDSSYMQPLGIADDRRYFDGSGSDELTYRVPLAEIPGAASVRVALYYQSIPPYYLRERFETASGPSTQRLHFLTSRLNLGAALKDWKLEIATAGAPLP